MNPAIPAPPQLYKGRPIIGRIPHTFAAKPMELSAGQHGTRVEEKGFFWNVDRALEIYAFVVRLYALDAQGRPFNEQPKVLPFFVRVRASSPWLNEHVGTLRPMYDETTPNTVIYRLPTPAIIERGESMDFVIETPESARENGFEVVLPGTRGDHPNMLFRFAKIRVEPFLEGGMLQLSVP